jgi:hypothetical protein
MFKRFVNLLRGYKLRFYDDESLISAYEILYFALDRSRIELSYPDKAQAALSLIRAEIVRRRGLA